MECPCCSLKPYSECCEPFHKGEKPSTPTQLMRSRYAAYALDLAPYIIETTHPENPYFHSDKKQWEREIHTFSSHTEFIDLKILETSKNRVKFHAILKSDGRDVSFTEDSLFIYENSKWFYKDGQMC